MDFLTQIDEVKENPVGAAGRNYHELLSLLSQRPTKAQVLAIPPRRRKATCSGLQIRTRAKQFALSSRARKKSLSGLCVRGLVDDVRTEIRKYTGGDLYTKVVF